MAVKRVELVELFPVPTEESSTIKPVQFNPRELLRHRLGFLSHRDPKKEIPIVPDITDGKLRRQVTHDLAVSIRRLGPGHVFLKELVRVAVEDTSFDGDNRGVAIGFLNGDIYYAPSVESFRLTNSVDPGMRAWAWAKDDLKARTRNMGWEEGVSVYSLAASVAMSEEPRKAEREEMERAKLEGERIREFIKKYGDRNIAAVAIKGYNPSGEFREIMARHSQKGPVLFLGDEGELVAVSSTDLIYPELNLFLS